VTTAAADTRTVELVWSVGDRVTRRGYLSDRVWVEELDMSPDAVDLSRLQNGAPLLDSHNQYDLRSQIGVVERAGIRQANGRREGWATVRFSDRVEVEPIYQDVRKRIIRNVSVGYSVQEWERVEGKRGEPPRMIARKWQPVELSLVCVPADMAAQIRAFENFNTNELREAVMATEQQNEGRHEAAYLTRDGAAAGFRAPPREPAATGDADLAAERQNERARVQAIYRLAAQMGVEHDRAADLVDEGATVDEARDALLSLRASRQPRFQRGGADRHQDPEGAREGAVVYLAHRLSGGLVEMTPEAERFRGARAVELADVIGRGGGGTRGGWLSRAGGGYDGTRASIGGLHSTSDLPELFASASNRVLQAAYERQGTPLLAIAKRVTTPDFRTLNRIRLSEGPALLPVGEHGEVTRGSVALANESYAVGAYARVFGVTRKALVDDDLNALGDVLQVMAAGAAQKTADVIVNVVTMNGGLGPVMSNGLNLFNVADGTLTPTGSAPSVASLSEARRLMRGQRGLSGEVIGAVPRFAICGPALETTFEQLLATLNAAEVSQTNPFSGKLTLLVENRLGNSGAWFLAADPVSRPVIEYAVLDGSRPYSGPAPRTARASTWTGWSSSAPGTLAPAPWGRSAS
jgi:CBS domain-containing protein